MSSNPDSSPPISPRESLAIVAIVLAAVISLWGVVAACRLYRFASWPVRMSNEFVLEAGVTGTWDCTWEPRSGIDRHRTVGLWPRPSREHGQAAEIEVNVEPPDAVVPHAATSQPAGWTSITSSAKGGGVLIDPPRVRRIHYRVVSVDPSLSGMRTHIRVLGNPESVHTEFAPFYLWFGVLVGLFGIVPSIVWYRRERSVRLSGPPTS